MKEENIKNNKLKLNKKETNDILNNLQYGISIKKIIHQGWKEYNIIKKKFKHKITRMFGKYQYIVTSERGKISIMHIKGSYKWNWEIYAFENKNLFEDTQTFSTKSEAINSAKKYLTK